MSPDHPDTCSSRLFPLLPNPSSILLAAGGTLAILPGHRPTLHTCHSPLSHPSSEATLVPLGPFLAPSLSQLQGKISTSTQIPILMFTIRHKLWNSNVKKNTFLFVCFDFNFCCTSPIPSDLNAKPYLGGKQRVTR